MYLRCLFILLNLSCAQILFGINCNLPGDSIKNKFEGKWSINKYCADSSFIFQPMQFQIRDKDTVYLGSSFDINILNDSIISFDYFKSASICGQVFESFEAEYTLNADTLFLSDKHYGIPGTFFRSDFICKMIADTLMYMKKIRNKPSEYSELLNDIVHTDIEQLDEEARSAILILDTTSVSWIISEDSLLEGYWGDYKIIQIGLSDDKRSSVFYLRNIYKYDLAEMRELAEFKSCPTIILNKPLQVFSIGNEMILACQLKDCESVNNKIIYLRIW